MERHNDVSGFSKQSPSPIINTKQQKEKENVASKKDLFGAQRSGSARRTVYLSNAFK